jgi:NAD(P)-dependent dehydrogenase (short-subunit alcohol dehydrogenase family)
LSLLFASVALQEYSPLIVNQYDLTKRNAIITGGAGGIGCSVARHMLEAGANVELWDISSESLSRAVVGLGAPKDRLSIRVLDITQEQDVAAAALECLRERERIDILVNNAGILGEVKPVWETDPEDFRRVLNVNLVGPYLMTRAIVGLMRKQKPRPHRGHIVNVSSIQGKEGMAMSAAYGASKAGVISLTKSTAKETATEDIIVTCITPSAAETAMATELSQQRRADILNRIPMGRFVNVDEVARLVLWLCTDDCSFSTGGIFDISGGRATY